MNSRKNDAEGRMPMDSPYLPQTNIFNRPDPNWPKNYKGWREMRDGQAHNELLENLAVHLLQRFAGCTSLNINTVVAEISKLARSPSSAGRIEYLMQDSVDGLFHLAVSAPPKETE
jgi:hypothetical protein